MKKSLFLSLMVFAFSCSSLDKLIVQYSPDVEIQSAEIVYQNFGKMTIRYTIKIVNKLSYPVNVKPITVSVEAAGGKSSQEIPAFTLASKEVKILTSETAMDVDNTFRNGREFTATINGRAIFEMEKIDQIKWQGKKETTKQFSLEKASRTPAYPIFAIDAVELVSVDYLGASLNVKAGLMNEYSWQYDMLSSSFRVSSGNYSLAEENAAKPVVEKKGSLTLVTFPVRIHFLPLGQSLANFFKNENIRIKLDYSQKIKIDGQIHEYSSSKEKDLTLPELPSIRLIKANPSISSLDEIQMEVVLALKNHSVSPLEMNYPGYNFFLNDQIAVSGNSATKISIPPLSEKEVTLKNNISLSGVYTGMSASGGPVRVKLQAKSGNINGKIPSFTLPYENTWEVEKPSLPGVRFSSFQYQSHSLYPPSVRFILQLEVENKNNFPVTVDTISGSLSFQKTILSSFVAQKTKIYPKEKKTLSIPVTITRKDILSNLDSLKKASMDQFSAQGNIVLQAAGMPLKISWPQR